MTVNQIQAAYLISPYFKDLYQYIAQNNLPSTKTAIHKVETLAEKIYIARFIIIQIGQHTRTEMALLARPEICTNKIIMLYHSSLFTGHQSVIKTYLTTGDKFFITGLIHYLTSNIKECHICHLSRNDKIATRQLQTRINLNYKPLSELSMDLKVIPKSYKGHRYILCIIDEVTNYLIMVPKHQSRSKEIADSLIENVISKYCVPDYIIMDQDSAFMPSLMNYLFKKLNIKIKTVAP